MPAMPRPNLASCGEGWKGRHSARDQAKPQEHAAPRTRGRESSSRGTPNPQYPPARAGNRAGRVWGSRWRSLHARSIGTRGRPGARQERRRRRGAQGRAHRCCRHSIHPAERREQNPARLLSERTRHDVCPVLRRTRLARTLPLRRARPAAVSRPTITRNLPPQRPQPARAPPGCELAAELAPPCLNEPACSRFLPYLVRGPLTAKKKEVCPICTLRNRGDGRVPDDAVVVPAQRRPAHLPIPSPRHRHGAGARQVVPLRRAPCSTHASSLRPHSWCWCRPAAAHARNARAELRLGTSRATAVLGGVPRAAPGTRASARAP